MTLQQLLREGEIRLAGAGIAEAELDARRLLLAAFAMDEAHFLMEREKPLGETVAAERYLTDGEAVKRSSAGGKAAEKSPMSDEAVKRSSAGGETAEKSSAGCEAEKRSPENAGPCGGPRPPYMEEIARYHEMIAARARRVPLQYILGQQEFMGLTFAVSPHVLIPRQDTETLAELVLKEQKGPARRLLDLCTGSGCLAVSLAVLGGYQDVTAADLSAEALAVAERNARALLGGGWKIETWALVPRTPSAGAQAAGTPSAEAPVPGTPSAGAPVGTPFAGAPAVGTPSAEAPVPGTPSAGVPAAGIPSDEAPATRRFRLLRGDLFAALPPGARYDILVSNPPYIPSGMISGLQPEVRGHEPRMALDGSADGLIFYRRIAAEAPAHLNSGAAVYLEIGYDQAEAVRDILEAARFSGIEVFRDLPGLDRVVRAFFIP